MIDMGNGEEYLREAYKRRQELGITEADIAAARNPGDRRTPEKREMLRRIAERCRAASVEPLPANY